MPHAHIGGQLGVTHSVQQVVPLSLEAQIAKIACRRW
jgi:hypothetical protein